MKLRALVAAALAIGLVASFAIVGSTQDIKATVKVGSKFPNFTLKSDAGKTVKLSDYKGKVVVLNFYASWCPGCNDEAPHLEKEIWQKYKNKNVQVLGIAVQEGANPAPKFKKFRTAHGVTYPLLLNEQGDILVSMGFSGIPQCAVVDTTGKYVSSPDTIEGVQASLKKLVK